MVQTHRYIPDFGRGAGGYTIVPMRASATDKNRGINHRVIYKLPDRQFLGGFLSRRGPAQKGEIMFLQTVLVLAAALAAPAYARTLYIGGQSVALTSDKRSSPALAVQIPGDGIWYGFLMPGTAAGRLTVQLPPESQWPGQIFSLTVPSNHTFSTISADFPQIYTWDATFRNANPRWGNQDVHWDAALPSPNSLQSPLSGHPPIWPNFHVQTTCSATTGTYPDKGNPVLPNLANGNTAFASNQIQCWCRLKRRSDGANGGWVFRGTRPTADNCAVGCPRNCANGAADGTVFRSVLLSAFENP